MNLIESDFIPYVPGPLPPGPWLILAPHPDDETYGMGGSIRRAVGMGLEIYVVVMTDGALGGPDPALLVPQREFETQKAAKILGIHRVDFWREPDRKLNPRSDLILRLANIIRHKPIGTLFFPSLTEPHPDHRATAIIAWEACRVTDFTGNIVAYEISSHGPINLLLDITPQISDKEAAMAAYNSQESERPYARRVLAHNIARTWSLPDHVLYAESFLRIPLSNKSLAEISTSFFKIYQLGLLWSEPSDSNKISISTDYQPEIASSMKASIMSSGSEKITSDITSTSNAIASGHDDLPANLTSLSSAYTPLQSRNDLRHDRPIGLLLFHPSDSFGGAERITTSIIKLHDRSRIRIILIASPLLFKKENSERFISIFDLGLSNGFSTLRRAYSDALLLIGIARKEECKVALGMLHYGALVVAIMRLASWFKIKAISSPRTPSKLGIEFHVGHTGILAFKWRNLVKFFCRAANRILVNSNGQRDECIKIYGASANKMVVIHNGVDTSGLKHISCAQIGPLGPKNTLKLITFCRLAPEKSLHILFSALSLVLQKLDACLTIVGDGPEKDRLQQVAASLSISDHVVFLGHQPEPFSLISGADIFVHTSLFEGFPNVILEAMACSIPLIATDCDFGPREIINHGINGLLVPVNDPLRLADAIITLGESPKMRQDLVKQAHGTLKKFDVLAMVRSYEDTIVNLSN